jgi:hypothetical protein
VLFLLLLVFLVDLLLECVYVDFTDILGLYVGVSTLYMYNNHSQCLQYRVLIEGKRTSMLVREEQRAESVSVPIL